MNEEHSHLKKQNFVNALLLEVVELYLRMDGYLRYVRERASEHDANLINTYIRALNPIKENLRIIADIEWFAEPDLLDHHVKLHIIRPVQLLRQLHRFFYLVPRQSILVENYIFVNRLKEHILNDKTDVPTIVLNDEYTFSEINIASHFANLLMEHGFEGIGIEKQIVLYLAVSQISNPLMWTALVHELVHPIIEEEKLLLKADSELRESKCYEIYSNVDQELIVILRRWIEEFMADFVANKLFGPAYFSALSSYFLLQLGRLRWASAIHPTPVERVEAIRTDLKKRKLFSKVASAFQSFFEVALEINDSIFEGDITESRCDYCGAFIEQHIPKYDSLQPIAEKVERIISDSLRLTPFRPENLDTSCKLSKKLEEGILISSYRRSEADNKIKANLQMLRDKNSDREERVRLLKETFKVTAEEPSMISEIINAGWIYRTKILLPKFREIFFEQDLPIEEKLVEFRELYEKLDSILIKSIETSYIHDLFQKEIHHDSK